MDRKMYSGYRRRKSTGNKCRKYRRMQQGKRQAAILRSCPLAHTTKQAGDSQQEMMAEPITVYIQTEEELEEETTIKEEPNTAPVTVYIQEEIQTEEEEIKIKEEPDGEFIKTEEEETIIKEEPIDVDTETNYLHHHDRDSPMQGVSVNEVSGSLRRDKEDSAYGQEHNNYGGKGRGATGGKGRGATGGKGRGATGGKGRGAIKSQQSKFQKDKEVVCIAWGCTNSEGLRPDLLWADFPKSKYSCESWILRIRRADLLGKLTPEAKKWSKVCGDHFESSQFSDPNDRKSELKRDAVPTIVNVPSQPPPPPPPVKVVPPPPPVKLVRPPPPMKVVRPPRPVKVIRPPRPVKVVPLTPPMTVVRPSPSVRGVRPPPPVTVVPPQDNHTSMEPPPPVTVVLAQHSHIGVKPYMCAHCGESFGECSDLVAHSRIHQECEFKCEYCGLGFYTITFLARHIKSTHKDQFNEQNKINIYPYTKEEDITLKEPADTGEPDIDADKSGNESENESQDENRPTEDDEDEYPISEEEEDDEDDYLTSSSSEEEDKKPSKDDDYLPSDDDDAQLNQDLELDYGDPSESGDLDEKGKRYNKQRGAHLRKKRKKDDRPKPFKCDHCGTGFHKEKSLKVHMRNRCDQCGKCIDGPANMIRHMRSHTDERPFECEFCGKKFRQRNTLRVHITTHTGEKPYMCDQCGRCFNIRNKLTAHMTAHTDEKPFECDHCGRKFARRESIRKHMIVHTGEKPYKCKECGRAFNQSCNLRTHMKIHTREKREKSKSVSAAASGSPQGPASPDNT